MLPPAAAIASDSVLLRELLAISLTGIIFYTPLYAPNGSGDIVDFTFEYLNPAAQRMMRMPEVPSVTHNQQWPHSIAHGTFQFHVEAFVSGEPRQYNINYQADGYDNYYRLAARRAGTGLLVSFTDTADQPRSPVEMALRESQAAERIARAEAERQRGELERVFEQAPAAIAVYRGPNYTIELANATVARLWGRTREQLLGKGLFEALPEVAGMGYEQLLDEVMATGVPHVAQAMEAQHERDGRLDTVYWDFVYVPMYAAAGQINGAMVVATEVTTQVRARQQVEQLNHDLEARVHARTRELAEQQRLLNQILAQVPAAITTLRGPNHHFTFANDRYQQLVEGRVRVGQTVAETLPEVAEQGFVELLNNVYRSGQPFEGKEIAILLVQPGHPPAQHYLDFTYQPMPDEHGQPQGILVFAVDVTEQVRTRRQAETMQAALLAVAQRRAQERQDLLALFEQAPVAVALLREPDHQLDYYNSLFAQLFPGPDRKGQPVAAAYPALATAALLGQLDHVYRTGDTYQGTDVRLPAGALGPARYLTFTFQAYQEHGQIAGVAVFVHEVSEQVAARQQVLALNQELTATNAELHQSNTQLMRINADLDTFVYAASHDLKAPIANIEGLLDALRDYLPSGEQQPMVPRLVDMMQGAINRFQQTIGHLTDVTRLQHGVETEVDEIEVPQLLEDVRLDLLPLLESTQTQLHLAVVPCPRVQLSANHMRSILFNLLSNAVKYRAPDRAPVVQVRSRCTATQFVLEVQDNGLGLDEEQQGKLFTMFRRLHTHVEGSGVGLYLIKRMIELAGGQITVHSQLGVGSTFTIILPHTERR